VRILEGAEVVEVSGGPGAIRVVTKGGETVEGSHLLVAVGRKANVEDMGLDKAGVAFDRAVKVGADLRTTNRRVYAVGDAAGSLQFTHVAGYHAGVVIRAILFGLPAKAKTSHIPWATYTDPELAQVGMTEAEARKAHGIRLEVVRFPYHENDRAVTEGKTTGFIKVMVVKGRPVGATIVGAQAGELIGLWALALANGLKMSAIAGMVAPYPTLTEVSKRAAGAYFSPRLFDNPKVKRIVGLVQKWLP
jgi:pyruvate/2-oxoglutarate dehydrogenase complex dihydrolipoamide dehydrogenase (E3) component